MECAKEEREACHNSHFRYENGSSDANSGDAGDAVDRWGKNIYVGENCGLVP